jgi:hypothetical protein
MTDWFDVFGMVQCLAEARIDVADRIVLANPYDGAEYETIHDESDETKDIGPESFVEMRVFVDPDNHDARVFARDAIRAIKNRPILPGLTGQKVRVLIGGVSYAAEVLETQVPIPGYTFLLLLERVGKPNQITSQEETTYFSAGTILCARLEGDYYRLTPPPGRRDNHP